MKLNLFLSSIAVVVSGLVFYGLYEINHDKLGLAIVSAVVSLILLVFTMGASFSSYPRSTVMVKATPGVFWFVTLVANILFIVFDVPNVVLIISNALLLAICTAITYGIFKSKQ